MPSSASILVTIPISHFCEKARWALDRAGIEYTEKRHIQLVHWAAVKRAGGGMTAPVLRTPDGVYDESAAILVYADKHVSEDRRLYPSDAGQRAEVDALEQRFDTVLGPEGRRWLYDQVFTDARRYAPYNLTGVPRWERMMFPVVLAPAKLVIRRYLNVNPASVANAIERVDEEFDFVGELLSDSRRHLVGDRFSAADLAFAALASPLVVPENYGTPLPQPQDMHDEMATAIRRWRAHPAGAYALRMFAEERPAPKVTSL
ncbi:MAG TPA: glutathione S-transferase N-terminal domain-containing protein [Solirubrobacteraceae bacterium]|nr:glutathione S-transferase N-terminal domain-containing protein [Solirubrobacteraceae bacterium]